MDVALRLSLVLEIDSSLQLDDVTRRIGDDLSALDVVSILKAHFLSRC